MKDQTTAALADFIFKLRPGDIPAGGLHEAKRAIYNWFGLVMHARNEPGVGLIREWAMAQGGSGSSVVGSGGAQSSPALAAMVNGFASHVEDFDDTHYATIIHPTAPIWSAVLALGEQTGASGLEALTAFVLGVDVACRVGEAVYPSHYDRGYHITATAGSLGAAAAAAKLLRLGGEQIEEALGAASTFASGLRGTFGSMAKALHPGKAAMEGIWAAQLAAKGFTSGRTGLESPLGFCKVLSDRYDLSNITQALGQRWLVQENSIKPFACGVVAHAAIDGILQLRRGGLDHSQVLRIELRVSPRTAELTGNPEPQTGLEAKFSVQHSVAVALIDGRAGPSQYTDSRVVSPEVVTLRRQVGFETDPGIRTDEAWVTVVMTDGARRQVHAEHAVGSLENPMTDQDLEEKVRDLLHDRSEDERIELRETVYNLSGRSDLGVLGTLISGN